MENSSGIDRSDGLGTTGPSGYDRSWIARVRLIATALLPSAVRQAYFDGWQTAEAIYEFDCARCGASVQIPFIDVLHGAWGWKERLDPLDAQDVTSHFALTGSCLALDGGWPSVCFPVCAACGTRFAFYADFQEYHHSVYRIVAQALSVCEG